MSANKKAFTMIELIFVIVILGILAAVAVPKLSASRDDAYLTKGKSEVSAIKAGIGRYKMEQIAQGNYSTVYMSELDDTTSYNIADQKLFYSDTNASRRPLQEAIFSCSVVSNQGKAGKWSKSAAKSYSFWTTDSEKVDFTYSDTNGSFSCSIGVASNDLCRILTQ